MDDRITRVAVAIFSRWIIPFLARVHGERSPQNGLTRSIMLVGYPTPACVLQHRILGEHLTVQGARVTRFERLRVLGPQSKWWASSEEGRHFESFGSAVSYLLSESSVDYHFQRGVLDEFLRRAPRSWLLEDFFVPDAFLDAARATRAEAQVLLQNCAAVVLAESSYLTKRALLSVAREKGIPCWVFSPKGDWLRIDDSQDEDSVDDIYTKTSALLASDPELAKKAGTYLEKRFNGRTSGDFDAPLVYGRAGHSGTPLESRKILFMHVLRDANQLPLRKMSEAPFMPSYLEWTDVAFREIAKNPLDWWIKPHPARVGRPDELALLHALLEKNGVPPDIVREDIDTAEVLKRRLPIYTHSGTIALEAASVGYRAHVCSSKVPQEISWQSLDLESIEDSYGLDFVAASGGVLDPVQRELASVMLYLKFSRPAAGLSPRISFLDRSTRSKFKKSLRAQARQMGGRALSRKAHKLAASLASEVLAAQKP